jgi:hypothetical protein
MNFRDIKFVFTAFLAILIFVSTSAGLTVTGAAYIDTVSSGQEIAHEMTVSINKNDSPQDMSVDIFGFVMNEEGVNIELSPEDDIGPFTARPFLSVEPKNFTVEPGVPSKVLLTGTVPEDVGSGGRYALVTMKTKPKDQGSIVVTSAIQVLVLLTIKDSEQVMTGNITELDVSTDDNVTASFLFENTGNIHYKPFVGAVLKSEDGQVIKETPPKRITSIILPTNSRLCMVDVAPKADLSPGKYTIEASVTLEDGTFLDSKKTEFEI